MQLTVRCYAKKIIAANLESKNSDFKSSTKSDFECYFFKIETIQKNLNKKIPALSGDFFSAATEAEMESHKSLAFRF